MNKKITIIILALILTISTMTSIIAAASLQKENDSETETVVTMPNKYSSSRYSINESADATKELDVSKISPTASDKKVTYATSKKINDNYTIDIYTDSNSNEYMYSSSDELIGYNRHNKTIEEQLYPEKFTDRLRDINKENVITYAEKFASNFYGDELEGYVLEDVQMLGTDIYFILFELPAGKEDFIHVRRCTVCINSDGFIESCRLSQKVYNDSADLTALESVNKKDVVSGITKQLTELFSDARDINIQKVYLAEGGDSLRVEVTFTTDLNIENKMEGYNFGFNGENSYIIILYYPLS